MMKEKGNETNRNGIKYKNEMKNIIIDYCYMPKRHKTKQ
jgi:hypothetical protein